jgi:hypothetical protein
MIVKQKVFPTVGNISRRQGTLIHIPKDIANIIVKANENIIAIEINNLSINVSIMFLLLLINIVSRLNYRANLYSLSL